MAFHFPWDYEKAGFITQWFWVTYTGLNKYLNSSLHLVEVALQFLLPWASFFFWWFSGQLSCLIRCLLSQNEELLDQQEDLLVPDNRWQLTCVKFWNDWIYNDHILFCRLQVDQNEHDINVLEGALEKVRFLFINYIFILVTDDLFSCVRYSGLWTLSSLWFWPKTLGGIMTKCQTRNLAVPGLSPSLTTTWICFMVALSSYPTLANWFASCMC